MIYADLKGRLGNQMFIYAFAYALSRENNDEPICFCGAGDGNSLIHYPLRNVAAKETQRFHRTAFQRVLGKAYASAAETKSRNELLEFERRRSKLYQAHGLYVCQNGYLPFARRNCARKDVFLNGYFQSERYFAGVSDELKDIFGVYTHAAGHGKNTGGGYLKALRCAWISGSEIMSTIHSTAFVRWITINGR